MKHGLIRKLVRRLAILIGALVVVFFVFILEENVRGRILLARYKAELRAKGEKLTLAELDLPKPPSGTNGAAALLAAADERGRATRPPSSRRRFAEDEFSAPSAEERAGWFDAGSLLFVGPGKAVVMHKQETVLHRSPVYRTVIEPLVSWEELSNTMVAAAPPLEKVQQVLSGPPFCAELDYTAGLEMHLPHLSPIRTLSKAFTKVALLKLHDGDVEGALSCLEAMAKLGKLLASDRNVICQIARQNIEASVLNVAWECVQVDNLTDSQLEQLQQICAMPNVTDDMIRALEMDVISYQRVFRKTREMDWSQIREDLRPGGWKELLGLPIELPVLATWKLSCLDQDERRALEFWYANLQKERDALRSGCWTKALSLLPESEFPRPTRWLYDHWRYIFSSIGFGANPRGPVLHCFSFQTQRELAVAAVALKRYELRYGKPAPSLGALVPEFLSELPRDYMDGQPLRYRVKADGAFVLYSVGRDGRDDGGDPAPAHGDKVIISIWDGRDAVWPKTAE